MSDLTTYGFAVPQAPSSDAKKNLRDAKSLEHEDKDYIECDWAEMRCVLCNHLAFWFDEKMQKDPAFALASHLVMKKHKDETGHDQWRGIPKWNDKDGAMPRGQNNTQ